ncbi:MAG: MaoC family dehydratase [Halioglobus sp.]|nr:MaoC family dehydratase [Halioglobus sp.]
MAGLWFEEFEDDMVFEHELSRTVTEADNMWFCNATLNNQPLHIDYHHAAQTEYGKPLVNSLFTLGLVIGMTVNDTTLGTTVANLGMSSTTFPAPVFFGDTIRARTTVIGKRASSSRPGQGIVNFRHEGINHEGVVVCVTERAALMHGRPARDNG